MKRNGTVAYDSSGNGNDGNLINGPTWTDGKIGNALSFDGVNDMFNVGYKPNSSIVRRYSIQFGQDQCFNL